MKQPPPPPPETGGGGFTVVKVTTFAVPPPGAVFTTVTLAVLATAMSAALMVAVSRVKETNVVVRVAPFQRTTDELTKPVPSTVSTKSPPPAGLESGLMLESVGAGLFTTVVAVALLLAPTESPVNAATVAVLLNALLPLI